MSDGPRIGDFATELRGLIGGRVVCAQPGHGSMLTIDVAPPGEAEEVYGIRIYLADWALLRDHVECVAADMNDEAYAKARSEIFDLNGRMLLRVDLLPAAEVHLHFSGQLRMEIWPNTEAYGPNAELIRLFADGRHCRTLTG